MCVCCDINSAFVINTNMVASGSLCKGFCWITFDLKRDQPNFSEKLITEKTVFFNTAFWRTRMNLPVGRGVLWETYFHLRSTWKWRQLIQCVLSLKWYTLLKKSITQILLISIKNCVSKQLFKKIREILSFIGGCLTSLFSLFVLPLLSCFGLRGCEIVTKRDKKYISKSYMF